MSRRLLERPPPPTWVRAAGEALLELVLVRRTKLPNGGAALMAPRKRSLPLSQRPGRPS